jgi:hypothetical protein
MWIIKEFDAENEKDYNNIAVHTDAVICGGVRKERLRQKHR